MIHFLNFSRKDFHSVLYALSSHFDYFQNREITLETGSLPAREGGLTALTLKFLDFNGFVNHLFTCLVSIELPLCAVVTPF